MTELDLRGNPSGGGYPHDEITLWLELYYLATVFGASKSIFKLLRKRGDEEQDYSLFSIFRKFEYSEASKRLISIAAICRNSMDTHPDQEIRTESESTNVGLLFEPINAQSKPLSFRESCHKILHADYINFDLTKKVDVRTGYLRPKIYLYGTKKLGEELKEWRATINIFDFIKAAWVCV